jgi:hypothetical protein
LRRMGDDAVAGVTCKNRSAVIDKKRVTSAPILHPCGRRPLCELTLSRESSSPSISARFRRMRSVLRRCWRHGAGVPRLSRCTPTGLRRRLSSR